MNTSTSQQKIPATLELFGHTVVDEHAWLRDPNYPDVKDTAILDFLEQQNASFDAWKSSNNVLIETLFAEIKGRIKEDDQSVPAKDRSYLYWWKFEPENQYRIWYRRPADGDDATLYLNENLIAEGHDYFNLRQIAVAPDQERFAYSIDCDGSERYRIRVAAFPEHGDETIIEDVDHTSNSSGAVVWSACKDGFYYTELNDNLRPFRVRFHALSGSSDDADPIIFEEQDPAFFVSIGLTSDERYVIVASGTHETSEYRMMRNDVIDAQLVTVIERKPGIEYSIDTRGDDLLMLINDTHENFRLIELDAAAPDLTSAREIIAADDDHYLSSIRCFQDFTVISQTFEGLKGLRIRWPDGRDEAIKLDDDPATISFGDNREFDTAIVRLSYSSMVTPASVIDFNTETGDFNTRKTQEIPSGYERSNYHSTRMLCSSHDGAEVPLTIVHHVDFPKDGTGKVLLYGYGSYGAGMYPGFGASRMSLTDRGVAFAIAHIRGGDEMGYRWYREGKLEKKTNTFLDFIACAETLIDKGLSKPGNIAIMGGSAGGMLVGAVANMRPDLWRCVVAQVPFVDVLNTMLDDSLPLTPIEWPEWGNPKTDKAAFERILSYSPYDNIRSLPYPPMLVTAGLSDPRVTYWEPAKYVARLRERRTNDAPLYLKTNMGAGHFGVSGRYDSLHELAETYAFILDCFDD